MGAWIETLHQKQNLLSKLVAPFMGAWIETSFNWLTCISRQVAPFMGAWIETQAVLNKTVWQYSCSLYGSMDWNLDSITLPAGVLGCSLYGSMDWNSRGKSLFYVIFLGCSLYGSMDWNWTDRYPPLRALMLLPLWEHGLKPYRLQ